MPIPRLLVCLPDNTQHWNIRHCRTSTLLALFARCGPVVVPNRVLSVLLRSFYSIVVRCNNGCQRCKAKDLGWALITL